MMIKVASPAGWDFDGPLTQVVKVSSRGLRGEDRKAFVKRAGHSMLPYLDSVKIADDEVPVHTLAVGATEFHGGNRNGDGFTDATCRDHHKSFEKFARAFRNHKNSDPSKSYGIIKLAVYNTPMRRIELLVGYNADKQAAERNGGLVADKELDKLAKDGELAGSMACKIAFDCCSACGKKSRTRDEYCTAKTCKAGGCKDNLAKLVKLGNDWHHLIVDNPNPHWFDWSTVWRPADRIAYGGRADYLTKAAADLGFFGVGGAEMAEHLGIKLPAWLDQPAETHLAETGSALDLAIKMARGLDLIEQAGRTFALPDDVRYAFAARRSVPLNDLVTERTKVAEVLAALADEQVLVPLRDLGAWLGRSPETVKQAAARLPGAYARLRDGAQLRELLVDNPLSVAHVGCVSQRLRKQAAACRTTHSLDPDCVEARCVLAVGSGEPLPNNVIGVTTKTAADDGEAEALALTYAGYRASVLARMAGNCDDLLLTVRLALVQNRI